MKKRILFSYGEKLYCRRRRGRPLVKPKIPSCLSMDTHRQDIVCSLFTRHTDRSICLVGAKA